MNQYLHYPVRTEALRKYSNQGVYWSIAGLWLPTFLVFLAVVNKENLSAAVAIPHFVIWLVVLPIASGYLWLTHIPKWIESLSYRLEGNVLRIDEGAYNHKQTAIPIDLISEITITRGAAMRNYDVSIMSVKTLSGSDYGGAVLWGVKNAEDVRDTLLRIRDERAGRFGRNTPSANF